MNIVEGTLLNIGELTPVSFSFLPFVPKRIFWVKEPQGDTVRGKHAHKSCEQFLICVKGAIRVFLHNGIEEKAITLGSNECVHIPKGVWSEQKYLTGQDILLVLCSEDYSEQDYIRDWNEFTQYVNINIAS